MNEIKYPLTIVDTLYEMNIEISCHKYLTCIAQLMVENFQAHYEKDMNCDNKGMPARNNQHAHIHDIILNGKFIPKLTLAITKWKIASQNQWRRCS